MGAAPTAFHAGCRGAASPGSRVGCRPGDFPRPERPERRAQWASELVAHRCDVHIEVSNYTYISV